MFDRLIFRQKSAGEPSHLSLVARRAKWEKRPFRTCLPAGRLDDFPPSFSASDGQASFSFPPKADQPMAEAANSFLMLNFI